MSVLLLINPINASMAQESSTEPKITDCGKMGCDYFVGKHFMLGDVDDYSMTNASRLPKPAKKNSLHSSIFVGGWVNLHNIAESSRSAPLSGFKIVLSGGGAIFREVSREGASLSSDRQTLKVRGPSSETFQILINQPGKVEIKSYVEVADEEYSNLAVDQGVIVAYPKTQMKSKKTITCVKGKLTKKVTAVKPKCPTGYKKK